MWVQQDRDTKTEKGGGNASLFLLFGNQLYPGYQYVGYKSVPIKTAEQVAAICRFRRSRLLLKLRRLRLPLWAFASRGLRGVALCGSA